MDIVSARMEEGIFGFADSVMVVRGIGDDEIEFPIEIVCKKIARDDPALDTVDASILNIEQGVVGLLVDLGERDGIVSGNQQTEYSAACTDVEHGASGVETGDEIVEKMGVTVEKKPFTLLI